MGHGQATASHRGMVSLLISAAWTEAESGKDQGDDLMTTWASQSLSNAKCPIVIQWLRTAIDDTLNFPTVIPKGHMLL